MPDKQADSTHTFLSALHWDKSRYVSDWDCISTSSRIAQCDISIWFIFGHAVTGERTKFRKFSAPRNWNLETALVNSSCSIVLALMNKWAEIGLLLTSSKYYDNAHSISLKGSSQTVCVVVVLIYSSCFAWNCQIAKCCWQVGTI